MNAVRLLSGLVLLLATNALSAQSVKPPTADDVKALLAKYHAERDTVVKKGIAQRFPPAQLERAEGLARKGAAMLTAGRLLQAADALRQARWQLPYQAPGTPAEHVARIIGDARLRHGGSIFAVAFSPDGRRLATAGEDQAVKLWDVGNGHERLRYTGHDSAAHLVAFSPDGRTVASCGVESAIRLWDADTGKDVRTFSVKGGQHVKALAFARDGKILCAAFDAAPQSNSKQGPAALLVCFDVATGAVKRTDSDFRQPITALTFSKDGTRLAVSDEGGRYRLWQYPGMIDNPKQPAYWTHQDDGGSIAAVAFSPDGKILVCARDNGVRLYDTPQPGTRLQVRLSLPDTAFTTALAFSTDGKTLFTGGKAGLIRSWDPESGQLLGALTGHAGAVWSLAFNPRANQLASAAATSAARLWDFGVVLSARDLAEAPAAVWSVAFSPDGERVVAASGDKNVHVWELAGGKEALTLAGHTGPVTAALFRPDGKVIASVGSDKLLRLWDAASGKELQQGAGHTAVITSLDISADGKRIVTGGADRRVILWDGETAKQIVAIDDNPSMVAAVALAPDGKQIAVGNVDQTIALYDYAGKLQRRWTAHAVSVNSLAYSPNARLLVSGGNDGLVKVWSAIDPAAAPIVLPGHTGPVSAVAFRKDSQHVASAGADHLVKLWRLESNTGKEIQTFRGHRDWVTSVAFNKEGFLIVSGSVDRRIKLWEITSREVPLLAEHTADVLTVAVSPDGKQIASAGKDDMIKVWDRSTGALLANLSAQAGGVTALAYAPDGKTLLSSGQDRAIRLWDAASFKEMPLSAEQRGTFKGFAYYCPYLFITPAADRLLAWIPTSSSATATSHVKCFAWPSGKWLFDFNDGPRKVGSLAFCANGKLAATGAQGGSVRIWKLEDNRAEIIPGGDWTLFDKVSVADLALAPDGTTLVATSDNGEIKIADIARRTVRKTVTGHKGRITSCQVSPDGKRFITVGADGLVKCWDMDGKELRQWALGAAATPVANAVFTPDSRQLVTSNADTTLFVLDLP